jgi:hypothetical protein
MGSCVHFAATSLAVAGRLMHFRRTQLSQGKDFDVNCAEALQPPYNHGCAFCGVFVSPTCSCGAAANRGLTPHVRRNGLAYS